MILYPDLYYPNVQSIPVEELIQREIRGIAIDVDNTLIDYRKEMNEAVPQWIQQVKEKGMKICILSNSNQEAKVAKVAKTLGIEYILSARKPMKKGFRKAMQKLALPAHQIAVVGDQVFTDVWGANRMHMLSVYVEPINVKEFWYTKWKRPLEKLVLNVKYQK